MNPLGEILQVQLRDIVRSRSKTRNLNLKKRSKIIGEVGVDEENRRSLVISIVKDQRSKY